MNYTLYKIRLYAIFSCIYQKKVVLLQRKSFFNNAYEKILMDHNGSHYHGGMWTKYEGQSTE